MIKKVMISIFLLFIIINFSAAKKPFINTEEVVYDETNNTRGFLAYPRDPGNYPAVILIHEWWGLNDYIRSRAKDFAGLGYVALAVDLYEGKSTQLPDEARTYAGEVRENMEKAFTNLEAAIRFIKKHPQADPGKTASVGWCFGGGWSYLIARNNLGVNASVIYYGRFNPEDDLTQMRAAILGNFGEDDVSIKLDSVKEFQAALKSLSGRHEIYIYPNAGHAFDNKDGSRYNKKASDLAWKRTIKFLNKILR